MKILFVLINPNNFILIDSLIENDCFVDIIFPNNIPMFDLINQKIHRYKNVHNTTTAESLFSTVENLLSKNNYDLIFPTFGDRTFKQFSEFNKKFNLKGIQPSTADKIKDKSKYYKIWKDLNILCPKIYAEIPPLQSLTQLPFEIKFPCIVKPALGSSGLGIQIIDNSNDLFLFFSDTDIQYHKYQEKNGDKFKGMQYCASNSNYIIQEYIQGNVISLIGHVYKNEISVDFIFDIETESYPYPAETSLIYPSVYEKESILIDIKEKLLKFFQNIEFNNSAFMLDVIIFENDFYFIDFAPRVSVSHNILYYAGEKNYGYKLAKKLITGEKFTLDIHKASMLKYLPFEKKKISSVKIKDENLAEVIKLPSGDIQMIRNDLSVFHNGYTIVTGKNRKDLELKYQAVLDSMDIIYL